MGRKFQFSLGEFYHLYNRGNDKRLIFLDDQDRARFVQLLFSCNGASPLIFKRLSKVEPWTHNGEGNDTILDIGAYCLMPNHFHILAREKIEDGISRFMQKLSTAYTMYFNKKYRRHGTIFEGRFKATFAEEDSHLERLFSYIHLNPVQLVEPEWKEKGLIDAEGARRFLGSYIYSSYSDYLGETRPAGAILNRAAFPEYFQTGKDFEYFLECWLTGERD